MNEALKASGYETKKEAVEQGLKLLVQKSKQQQIRNLRGKIKWEGDLDEMRSAR
jgi:Arc/MetJ family transcription regulator